LITDKIIADGSEWRATRDKVSKCLKRAIKNGELSETKERIIFGKFIAWAKTKKRWNEVLAEFRGIYVEDVKDPDPARGSDRIYIVDYPSTKEKSHKTILDLQKQLDKMERELSECIREKEQLQAKADRYDEICAKNRESGGKREM
jgi:predicted RNase H-like nuclease (RuvC/YqgF family)